MASLRRRHGSPYWTACFTDSKGKQQQRSTKEKNRAKALVIAQKWEEVNDLNVTVAQAQEIVSEIVKEIRGKPLPSITLTAFLAEWLAEKKDEIAVGTYDQYRNVADNCLMCLPEKAEVALSTLSYPDMIQMRTALSERFAPDTVNNNLNILRGAFKRAVQHRYMDENLLLSVKPVLVPVETQGVRRGLTPEEIKLLLACADPLWRGMILCGLYLGQRLGDIARLTWRKLIIEEHGGVKTYRFEVLTRKRRRTVIIPVAKPLLDYLLTLPQPSPDTPIFPAAFAKIDKKGRVQRLSNGFYGLMVKAALAPKRSKKNTGQGHSRRRTPNALGFHSLRYSATSLMKGAGVPDAIVMDIIGHDSVPISQQYTKIDDRTKYRAIQVLEDVTK